MAQVSVTIDGKQFRMACDDGQESHLEGLGLLLDERIKIMRQNFGEIGDLRLTVMAALMVCDELHEAREKLRVAEVLTQANRAALVDASSDITERDIGVASAINQLSERLERITRMLAGEPKA